MGGGLMQIITYGTQDLTLTGNPEITFFNIIYRRYTNFGIKMVSISFDNSPDFNTTSYLNIPKNNGDLMSKIILKIKLPKINMLNIQQLSSEIYTVNDKIINKVDYISNYEYYNFFYNKLLNITKQFFKSYSPNSLTYISDLRNYILKYLNIDSYTQFFLSINLFFNDGITDNKKYDVGLYTNASLFKIMNSKLIYIYELFTYETVTFDEFKFTVNNNLNILKELNSVIYAKLLDILFNKSTIKFCWVNKVAIYLLNSIEFYIGSNKIYSLSDTYINNYGELNYKNKELYDKMIGNNQDINKFDVSHDETVLYLPIPFWNFNNYGLAFPLISLQYNSVQIRINIKKFLECIRIYNDENIRETFINNDLINLLANDIMNLTSNKLEITALVEYIYLDLVERRKFAQSAHEYLIEQVQELDFDLLSKNNNSFQLDIFHCCKDMYWFAKKYSNLNDIFNNNPNVYEYIYSRKPIQYDKDELLLVNYISMIYFPYYLFNPYLFNRGVFLLNNISKFSGRIFFIVDYLSNLFLQSPYNKYFNIIINESYLYLNSTQFTGETSFFYNFLHPYNYYNASPQLGLNVYSLCLKPTEFQPSGSCNMSRISSINLKLKINEKKINAYEDFFLKAPLESSEYKLVFQTRNFNILRIIGGIGATAYTY
jgi:hypothetical protein